MKELTDSDLVQLEGAGCGKWQRYIRRATTLYNNGEMYQDDYEYVVNGFIEQYSNCLGYN